MLHVADPAKKTKHVVVPRKQGIIGVDGIDEMNLFTGLPQKLRIIQCNMILIYFISYIS